MQPSIILLLLLFIGLAALAYYLSFVQPPRCLSHLSRRAFPVYLLLIAFTIWALSRQATDQSRLEALGLIAHPSLEHSIGVPAGPGIDPTWVFHASTPPRAILEFYRNQENREGWSLRSDNSPLMLVLEKEDRRLTIAATEKPGDAATVSFLLSETR